MPLTLALLLAGCAASPTDAPPPSTNHVVPTVLTGDVDGDGVDEVVTAWLGASGERGFFTLDDDGTTTTTPVYPIWSAQLTDLNGDGQLEIVAGSWSFTPRHDEPQPHRAAWVLTAEAGQLLTIWRGSAFARPLRDLRTGDVDGDGRGEIVTLETGAPGRCRIAAYRWTGFGVAALAHTPVRCSGLYFANPVGQDSGPLLVVTSSGRWSVRLAAEELVLDVLD